MLAPFRVRWVMMKVGSINAVKLVMLVEVSDQVDGRGYISTTIIIRDQGCGQMTRNGYKLNLEG